MSFPYTQCISAITIPAGEYKNYTFVVAAYQSGISVGQFSPNSTPPNYTLGGVSNLDNNGASTTAIEFLLDYSNTDYSPPYYFVYGSEDENIWLNSINPATGGSHFTSSNVTTQIASEKQPDAPIARLFYYFPESLLYVAASNGNLYWYSVTWSSDGKPSLSYVSSNTSYNGDGDYEPSGAPISLTFFPAKTLTDYDCLLLGGVKEATWVMFNAQNPSSTPHLFSCPTGAFEGTATATGICKGPEGIYWSTGYSLNYMDYGNWDVSLDLLLGFRDSFPVRSVSSQLKSNPSDNFHTWSYESVRPFQLLTLGKILGKLPVTVLRAKGILSTVEYPNRRVILQQVGPRITLEIGEEWGNNPPFTQLVLISTETINTNILQNQLDSCLRVEDFEVNSKTQTKNNFILSNEI
ncbi:hypothetical protein MICAF_5140003 [Microcystis aeruginosa PCC 9807]|uniref:CobW C-terminal domain-containing protein n=1 Tax=Microcystis aeruginosa PCC 9807 TaxID=1160283 RepID=I4HBW1_MICAE|nr:GTP-binding protein [Microcystis aeruginosa]CCI19535.1 hypothetical protein MICAF_5140003 [Microcystis aeruginosa PCC 9807]